MASMAAGEAGHKTSYSPVGAGNEAELGKNIHHCILLRFIFFYFRNIAQFSLVRKVLRYVFSNIFNWVILGLGLSCFIIS